YITENQGVPGQGTAESLSNHKKDWMYATASLTYDFSDYFNVTLAYDKNHIGDGYRSVLLSDFSSNYTHLKLNGKIGNVQYTSRSEEHTSELQSRENLVCRLLLEKKKNAARVEMTNKHQTSKSYNIDIRATNKL